VSTANTLRVLVPNFILEKVFALRELNSENSVGKLCLIRIGKIRIRIFRRSKPVTIVPFEDKP